MAHARQEVRDGTPAQARFEEVWNQHYLDVFRFALRRVGNEQSADEICAETFVVAWRKLDAVPSAAKPWLLAVARRVLANHVRGESRRSALVARLERVGAKHERSQDQGSASPLLAAAFNSLSEGDREVLSLVAWEELKPGDAATVLGISPARFSVRLHRAKRRLRKRLEGAGANARLEQESSTAAQSSSHVAMEASR